MALLTGNAQAQAQWSQWGGPQRNFSCPPAALAETWPEGGPPRLWRRDIGPGHSAIAVDGGVLYTMYRAGEQEVVLAVRAATGETVWETKYDAPAKPDMLLDFGPGPHATPLVAGGRVFTIGGLVHLRCLDAATGKVLWGHDLMDKLGASHLQRGYGASPVAWRDLVIVNVGGPDVGVAAFRQDSGEIAWKSEPMRGGYPTPLPVTLNGEEHLLVTMGATRAGLDPATGKTLWKLVVDRQLGGIMSTPLWIGPDRVLYSSAYGGGTQLLRIARRDDTCAAEEVWLNRKMRVCHGTLVRIGDVVYGSSWDFGPAFLMAIRLGDGEILWRDRTFAKATLLEVGGKLLILDEQGWLALAVPSTEGLRVLARAQVLEERAWTVPTLVGTRLYLRDQKTLLALDLGRS